TYLSNYDLSDEALEKIQLLYACCHGTDHIEDSSLQKFIDDHTQPRGLPSLALFNQKILETERQISTEKDPYKREILQKKKQRLRLCASLILEKSNSSLTEDQQSYFITALEHRNQKESLFLLQILAKNWENPDYFPAYQKLVDNKKHLILPMIFVSQWLIQRPLSPVCETNLTEMTNFLKANKQRSSLRDAKGILSNLLKALIALTRSHTTSSEKKIHLLNQCLQVSLPIDEAKGWEKRCKRALDTTYVLATMNLLEPMLHELNDNYSFESIISLFKTKLQDIFDTPIEHFYEKYLKMEETLRVPLTLLKYASNLKSNKEPRVSEELQRLVTHILEDSVKQERYQVKNNPHLTRMKEGFPEIFQAWQITQEAIKVIPGKAKQESMDFFAFLKEKIL
ncbi:MAG: hypothetical protein AABZ92_06290, partial [Verrucomicrobiota bacterium]